jgi:two-component system, NarL family, response regulator NreC
MRPIRVLIADDHELLRTGLRRIIERQPDMAVVGEAADAQETVSRVAETRPNLLLLDVAMPGGGGLAALRAVRERWPAIKALMVTMYDDHAHLRLALEAGASGYVIKSASAEELVEAIRTVHGGRTYVSPCLDNGVAAGVAGDATGQGQCKSVALSAREREVVRMVARGHTAREAAQKLGLSVKTVEAYRLKVMEKLGLESRAELVSYALAAGLLVPGPDDRAG